jgi:hypothetical protein
MRDKKEIDKLVGGNQEDLQRKFDPYCQEKWPMTITSVSIASEQAWPNTWSAETGTAQKFGNQSMGSLGSS